MVTRTARYVTYTEDAADEPTQRATAVDTLREGLRADGAMLNEDTVTRGPVVPVLIRPDTTYIPVDAEDANGFYVDWTATGTPRTTDTEVPVVIVDADGWVIVPEPVASGGGDLRVRHDSGEVTVTAYGPDEQKVSYLFATPVDDDTVHMELLGGTARLHVTSDSPA